MNNQKETGKTIAELRKQAGFTQKSLAEALFVTDKAVSKWERGLACPDISLLPKLSSLLDADIEALLLGVSTINFHLWKGILFLDGIIPVDTIVYDKPMVYYLISIFMLTGISEILIVGNKKNIEAVQRVFSDKKIGVILHFFVCDSKEWDYVFYSNKDYIINHNILLISSPIFLFAASLTRQLNFYTSLSDNFIRVKQQNGELLPIFFILSTGWKRLFNDNSGEENILTTIEKESVARTLNRGTICIPFSNYEQINDIASFVRFFQSYHKQEISDLKEIAINRNMIKE